MKTVLTTCLILLAFNTTGLMAQDQPEVVVESAIISEQELDQMLAPIALYPDTVLAHVLIAATYPLEVVQAARWAERNPDLEGDDALQAVENEDWDPSVKALVAFPEILQRMSEDLSWTERLGNAFLDDEERVTLRVQYLRQRAYDEGNLENLEHLKVVKEEESIIIEPAVREVVYVPYYDARYVYGSWWWHDYPPVYWHHPHHHFDSHFFTSFYWGPRIHISSGFFFSGFHWHDHHIVVVDHYWHQPRHYYNSRYVVRHRDARRWVHNPQHRRGVDYRNPRTRDYFESRKRNTATTANYRNDNRDDVARTTRSLEKREGMRFDQSRRNADYVQERLQRNKGRVQQSDNSNRTVPAGRNLSNRTGSENTEAVNRQAREAQNKHDQQQRGNIKLSPNERESRGRNETQSDTQGRQAVRNVQQVPSRTSQSIDATKGRVVREYRAPSVPVERVQREEPKTSERAALSNSRSSSKQQSSGRNDQRSSRGNRESVRRER